MADLCTYCGADYHRSADCLLAPGAVEFPDAITEEQARTHALGADLIEARDIITKLRAELAEETKRCETSLDLLVEVTNKEIDALEQLRQAQADLALARKERNDQYNQRISLVRDVTEETSRAVGTADMARPMDSVRAVCAALRQAQADLDIARIARADRDRLVSAAHEAAWPLGLGTMTTAEAIAEMGRLAAQRDAFGEQAEQAREREARLVAIVDDLRKERAYLHSIQRTAFGDGSLCAVRDAIARFDRVLWEPKPTPTTDAEEADRG